MLRCLHAVLHLIQHRATYPALQIIITVHCRQKGQPVCHTYLVIIAMHFNVNSLPFLHTFCMQFVELAYFLYVRYYWYVTLLLTTTLITSLAGVSVLYKLRRQLYNSVVECHVVPIVQAGLVRYLAADCMPFMLMLCLSCVSTNCAFSVL